MAVTRQVNGTAQEFSVAATSFAYTGITVTAQTNQVFVVHCAWSADPGTVAATWDVVGANQACTLIRTAVNSRAASLLGLVNPTTGNKTLTITSTNSVGLIANVTTYSNACQAGGASTFANFTSAVDTTLLTTLVVTTDRDSMANETFAASTASGTSNQTLLFFTTGLGTEDGGASEGNNPSKIMFQWTLAGSTAWASVGVSVAHDMQFDQQPVSARVAEGQTATFNVVVSGNSSAVTYQWKKNGGNVGSNSNSYTTPVLTLANDLDTISVDITDSVETLSSVTCHCRVSPAGFSTWRKA